MLKQKRALAAFLLPGLTGLIVFYFAPFLYGVYFSVTDGTRLNAFVGPANYIAVWQNAMFRLGLRNTLELSLLCAPLVFIGSFLLSAALRTLGEKVAAYRTALLLPYLMPSGAVMLTFLLFFDFGGPLNRAVVALGLPRALWIESAMMRVPVVLLYVWKNIGFSIIIFSAAMQSVPQAFYEYASIEGAGRLRMEAAITLPSVLPTAFLVFVLSWISAFRIFKDVYFISGAYPDPSCYTLQHFMNNQFANYNYPYVTAAAYSFAVGIIAFFGVAAILEAKRRVIA